MKQHYSLVYVTICAVGLSLMGSGCAKKIDDGKIPITTSSEEAKKEFLSGRNLSENLLLTNSIKHFDKAIALDPNFALAHLGRANSAATAKEFFDHLKMAVAHADKASEGERLLILSNEAGTNANSQKQKEYLEKLVALYPKDERAHFNIGGFYFGQQEYVQAIEHYKKATELAPNYSPVYNILGYAYRQIENYPEAEGAFKKYTELIPNDPNPYDSYAELLLKMGRFDESIVYYQKALAVDQNFVASRIGIATNYMYKGMPDEATRELKTLYDMARNDGERRQAIFVQAVLYADIGKLDLAVQEAEKEYTVAEKINDAASMSADLAFKGNILVEMGKYDEALAAFERSVQLVEASDLSQEIKENTRLFHHFNLVPVALGKKEMKKAKEEAEEFRNGAEVSKNPNQIRQAHELMGIIALAEKNYDTAIAELQKSNQQNPYNLYRLASAYGAKGEKEKAREFYAKAARFNGLPALNYAFIRSKAMKMTAGV
jgi:tetratricopeptide (TPR) repeat protein